MRLTPEQIEQIKEMGKAGKTPAQIRREVGCLSSQVTYHLRDTDRPKRNNRGRPRRMKPPADDVEVVELGDEVPEDSEPIELQGELRLEGLDESETSDVNIRTLRRLRDDPNATVADRIRATDLLMRWQRKDTEEDLNVALTDAQYEDVVVTMMEEMDHKIRTRVMLRCKPLLSDIPGVTLETLEEAVPAVHRRGADTTRLERIFDKSE